MSKVKQVSSRYFCKFNKRNRPNRTGPFPDIRDILTAQPLKGCVTVKFKDMVNKCLKSSYGK
jgi:hypothetical protein